MKITFPTTIAPDHPRNLADEYHALEAKQLEAVQAIKQAERDHRTAQEAEVRSLAAAIRTGDKEPDSRQIKKAEAALEQARRRQAAITVALAACEQELITAVTDARDDWLQTLTAEREQHRAEFAEAVEQLAQALDRLAATNATARWVSDFPGSAGKHLYNASGVGVITTWRLPNGSHPSFNELLTALRELAQPHGGAAPRVVVGSFANPHDPQPRSQAYARARA